MIKVKVQTNCVLSMSNEIKVGDLRSEPYKNVPKTVRTSQ